jgi:large subunit ribosomal protein L4
MDSHKTSEFVSILKSLKLQEKKLTLLVSEQGNDNLDMSVRNLYNVYLVDSRKASTYDLIDCDVLVIDRDSVTILAEMLRD